MRLCVVILQILAVVRALSHHRYSNPIYPGYSRTCSEQLQTRADCKFNICEDVSDYPEQDVNRIVKRQKAFHSFLKGQVMAPAANFAVGTRFGEEEKTLCKTVDVVAAPRLMLDIDNVRRHIVNLQNYTQILKFQTCVSNHGEECFKETILGVKTKCVQKFNNIKLITVDVNDEILEYRIFMIPTTCVCTYSKDFS